MRDFKVTDKIFWPELIKSMEINGVHYDFYARTENIPNEPIIPQDCFELTIKDIEAISTMMISNEFYLSEPSRVFEMAIDVLKKWKLRHPK
jgi:hypothetical protein